MKNMYWKKWVWCGLILMEAMILLIFLLPGAAFAQEARTVRVAFFPMQGFHTWSEADGYSGVDVDYLKELCGYTGWEIEYVRCDSWDDALAKLENKEVDLVGSAQYSEERAEIFDYASLSSGYTFGCLFVEEGSRLAFEDFDRMESMTFGVVKSYIRKVDFLEYLKQNGVANPRLQEYGTTQEMQEALQLKKIDIAVHTLTEVGEGQCLVGKFAYAPYYYITWKGNEELLNQLNKGTEEVKMNSPALEQELISRYYGDRRENFAAEELQVIQRGDTIKIGFYKDTMPLAYINAQGEYDGIYIQILKAVSQRSGIRMEFCPLERHQYWKDLLMKGEIDFYAGSSNMKFGRDENIILTNAFMEYNAVIVSRNNYTLSDGEATTVLTRGRAYWADSMDIKGPVIYCDSAKDCLEELENGRADITILDTIEYNYQSKNERFSNLIEWENYRYQSGTALAASRYVDPVLPGIMNKALGLISGAEKEDIINQYMNIPYDSYGLRDYLYQTKDVLVIFGAVLLLLLIFGYIVSHMRRKSYARLEYKNRELQAAIQEATRANQAKAEFLSHMSHDIRTPINGIMGMLDIAEKNPEDPDRQADCRGKIRTSAEHLLSLINDVLDISKLESGNVEFAMERFSLKQLLHNCSVIVGGQAAQKNVKLVTDFSEPGRLPHEYFSGSPLHIKQILINIAGNAVKYNKPMGSIIFKCHELYAENGTAHICFEISDTGIGMDASWLKHIFEPFTQESSGARTNYQGTGLGMAITKKLVDKMGGTIQVESELDKGSVFTVVLPLKIAELPEIEKESKDTEQAVLAGKKALLVEDNELNQEIARYILEESGLEVTLAVNGKEAVDLFREAEPHTWQIIFMDVMMPVMNGYEATQSIRGLDRPDAAEIPVIAMTANAFAEDIKESVKAGMNEHLAKPLDPEMINHVLQKWLGAENIPQERP